MNDESTFRDGNYVEFDCDICGGVLGFEYDSEGMDRTLVKNCNCVLE